MRAKREPGPMGRCRRNCGEKTGVLYPAESVKGGDGSWEETKQVEAYERLEGEKFKG